MPIMTISYSKVNLWDLCPKAYEYQYIKKLPLKGSGLMIAGTAYDRGVTFALGTKANGLTFEEEEIISVISDAWDGEINSKTIKEEDSDIVIPIKSIEWGDYDPGVLKDRVIKLVLMYIDRMLPNLNPVMVQKYHSVEIVPGLVLTGRPDVEFEDGNIADHKFTKRRMSDTEKDDNMQSSAYATILNHPLTCEFHLALNQKKLDIEVMPVKRTQSDIDWYREKVLLTARLIYTGIFPPRAMGWKCSPKYCDFYHECRTFGG